MNNQVEISYLNNKNVIVYKIPPKLTDVNIDNWLEPHYVAFNLSLKIRPELFLFLGGSFGKPGQQKLFLQEIINLGYIVIHLNYPNDWTIANLCQNSNQFNCHEKKRKAIIYGQTNARNNIIITPANSIENRLAKLLLFLTNYLPELSWSNYLKHNQIKWESIIIAGHSQGGGHAAIIAQDYLVSRVIMLSSPADYNQHYNQMASWLSTPTVTPSERFYGFVHLQDPAYPRIIKAWNLLGLSNHGDLINIDHIPISEVNSHQLVTSKLTATPHKFHGSIFNDRHTPKFSDGRPLYKEVWQYLCLHPNLN